MHSATVAASCSPGQSLANPQRFSLHSHPFRFTVLQICQDRVSRFLFHRRRPDFKEARRLVSCAPECHKRTIFQHASSCSGKRPPLARMRNPESCHRVTQTACRHAGARAFSRSRQELSREKRAMRRGASGTKRPNLSQLESKGARW